MEESSNTRPPILEKEEVSILKRRKRKAQNYGQRERYFIVDLRKANDTLDEAIKKKDEVIVKTGATFKANEQELNDVKATFNKYECQRDEISAVGRSKPGCN
ncbi:hypothetical protein J1N35_012019 [Gossypium stocksii]|uniref:Uncharacterized protein n=1 Tax=Gossypium stocksii TaxID=47602 RepID=A0A9D3W3G6_9ROSI|nr:hypothetical protein J1N35_012019 [Gossypium stocksii]